MAKIQEVDYPFGEVATDLIVYVQGFSTSSNTCRINYVLTNEVGKQLFIDSYELTEEEFIGWGEDNSYIDQIAAARIPVTIIDEPIAE
jgi:hypothetical protein